MARQNVFDEDVFFAGYRKIRAKDGNANDLFEIPALLSILPELKGKRVLDLGCGYGEHCKLFLERGAESVTGIDISEKMLAVARQENSDPRIRYLHMAIEDIGQLKETFDVVVSSLALHYVEDFSGVCQNVCGLLSPGGIFLFSQEHPLVTSHSGGDRWTKNEAGEKLHVNISNYGVEGLRETTWFIDHIRIYHRTFSGIINALLEAGFSIERMVEPLPTEELLERYPDHKDLLHKPDFLLLKVKKCLNPRPLK